MQAIERHAFPSAHRPRATTDYQFFALWLHGRPPTTRRYCAAAVVRFERYRGHPPGTVTPADVRGFADSLGDLTPTARARLVGAVRSFYQVDHRLGFRPPDLAAGMGPPAKGRATAQRSGALSKHGPPYPQRQRRSPAHQAGQPQTLRVTRGSHVRRATTQRAERGAPLSLVEGSLDHGREVTTPVAGTRPGRSWARDQKLGAPGARPFAQGGPQQGGDNDASDPSVPILR